MNAHFQKTVAAKVTRLKLPSLSRRRTRRNILITSIAAVCSMVLVGCATHSTQRSFPEASTLPSQPSLPDPLLALDGSKVTSRSQWFNERRPELQALFSYYMYGPIPPKPAHFHPRLTGEYHDFLNGKATLKLFTLETGSGNAPRIDLMVVLPKKHDGPTPVFLAMDFCGNHTLTADPRVPLSKTWLSKSCPGCPRNVATDAGRGAQATNWPLEEIVNRGYGLAAFYSGDVDSDRAEVSSGLYAWLADGDPARNNPTNRGTIAAWAWGFQRCVDYLVTDRDVDAHRIAAVGHSRNGKTALLAAAYDDRISMAFPHQAGCGGTAPSRGKVGESVKAINDHFPYWFNAEFKKFNDAPDRLPFDQNCLVALCAPRPVLFSAAEGDQWANPAGQFEALKAADPVYRLLAAEGLAVSEMPPHGKLVDSPLGYYIREGNHSMTANDWKVFMDFADRHWRK